MRPWFPFERFQALSFAYKLCGVTSFTVQPPSRKLWDRRKLVKTAAATSQAVVVLREPRTLCSSYRWVLGETTNHFSSKTVILSPRSVQLRQEHRRKHTVRIFVFFWQKICISCTRWNKTVIYFKISTSKLYRQLLKPLVTHRLY